MILVSIIFILGILIGNQVEDLRIQNLYEQYEQTSLETQQVTTEINYLNYLIDLKSENNSDISCSILEDSYITSLRFLDQSRIKLETYLDNADSSVEEEYANLKERYATLQVNYWILADKINNMCDSNFKTILYFYKEQKRCGPCFDQGVYLDYVKKKLNDDVMIFALDSDKQGPVKLLANTYNISFREHPVLVIDEKVYGFSTSDEIFEILCQDNFDNKVCLEK